MAAERPRAGGPRREAPADERPWAYRLVVISILGVILAFLIVMLLFAWLEVFTEDNAANVSAALSSLFGIVGTLVGAYFGIKTSSESHTEAAATARSALDSLAGRDTVGRVDLVSFINDLHAAWNATNAELVISFFADDAVVSLASLPPRIPATYTGKGEVRAFVQKYIPASQLDARNYRQEEGRVKWEFTATWELAEAEAPEGLREMGISRVEGSTVAQFEGSKITSLAVTLTPSSQAAVQGAGG